MKLIVAIGHKIFFGLRHILSYTVLEQTVIIFDTELYLYYFSCLTYPLSDWYWYFVGMCEFVQSGFIWNLLFQENLCLARIECLFLSSLIKSYLSCLIFKRQSYLHILCNLLVTVYNGSFPLASVKTCFLYSTNYLVNTFVSLSCLYVYSVCIFFCALENMINGICYTCLWVFKKIATLSGLHFSNLPYMAIRMFIWDYFYFNSSFLS